MGRSITTDIPTCNSFKHIPSKFQLVKLEYYYSCHTNVKHSKTHTNQLCACVFFFQSHLLLLANSVLTVCKIPRKLVANTELLTSFLFMRKPLMGVVAKGQGAGKESCCINFWLEFICLSSEVELTVNGIDRFKLRRRPTVSCVCVSLRVEDFSLCSLPTGVKAHWLRCLHFRVSAASIRVHTYECATDHRWNEKRWQILISELQLHFRANVRPHLDVLVYISETMASVHPSWLAARPLCHLLFLSSACTAALASTVSETSVPFCASTLSSVNNLHLGPAGLQGTHFQHEMPEITTCSKFPAHVVM